VLVAAAEWVARSVLHMAHTLVYLLVLSKAGHELGRKALLWQVATMGLGVHHCMRVPRILLEEVSPRGLWGRGS